ncbi:MAG: SDR family oxidoreductase [Pseudomonadota bacterium]
MDLFDLSGRRALVTGASSGLGANFAKVLASAGAEVILAARRVDRLEALADSIAQAGGSAFPVPMDVTDEGSILAAFDAIDARGGPATILVNNSGLSRESWLTDMTEADWDTVIGTNLKGAWRVAQETAKRMIAAETGGSVINISSITAFRPAHMLGAYAPSKAAIQHLTHVMALEWARAGIRVNAIAPGYFSTEINNEFLASEPGEKMRKRVPMRRFGELEELSGPLLLLASDAGSYMTGSTLVVDGGHLQSSL